MPEIDHGAAYEFARDFSVGLISRHQTPVVLPWGEEIPDEEDFYLGKLKLKKPVELWDVTSDDRLPILNDREMKSVLTSRLARSYVQDLIFEGNLDDRFIVGLILSAQGEGVLSSDMIETLEAKRRRDLEVVHQYKRWEICSSGEGYLKDSMQDGGTLLVNDSLLVKDQGYSVGIAVNNIVTPTGTFYKGAWYRPVGQTRVQVMRALRTKAGELQTEDRAQWAFVRDSSMYRDEDEFNDLISKVDNQVMLHAQGRIERDTSKSRLITEF